MKFSSLTKLKLSFFDVDFKTYVHLAITKAITNKLIVLVVRNSESTLNTCFVRSYDFEIHLAP